MTNDLSLLISAEWVSARQICFTSPPPSASPHHFAGYKNVTHKQKALTARRFFTSFRKTIHNNVILSKAKDLKVYATVDGRTDCEILHFVQDDNLNHSSSLRGIAEFSAILNTYNPPQTPPFEKEGLVVALGNSAYGRSDAFQRINIVIARNCIGCLC